MKPAVLFKINPTHKLGNTVISLWIWKSAKANLFYFSENRDPVVKILGPSFASILEKVDTHTDALSLADKVKEEDQGEDSEVKVKLFLLLQNMDNQLLNKCLKEISE